MRQRYGEAMAVRLIARALNRSPNAVSKSLGRIRRLLLDCVHGDSADKGQGRPPVMNNPSDRWQDFDRLVNRVVDGIGSDEDAPELNQILRSDAEACRRYLRYMGVHSRLFWPDGRIEREQSPPRTGSEGAVGTAGASAAPRLSAPLFFLRSPPLHSSAVRRCATRSPC